MRKKISTLINKFRNLAMEREEILKELLVDEPLIKGSLSLVKRTCGKPNCRCAQEPCHKAWVLRGAWEGRERCQVVRKADVQDVQSLVDACKLYQTHLRRLEAIAKQQKDILRDLMERRRVKYK